MSQVPDSISSTDEDWLASEVLSALDLQEAWDDYCNENHSFILDVLEACEEHCWLEKEDFDNGQPGGFGWSFTFIIRDKIKAKAEVASIINELKST